MTASNRSHPVSWRFRLPRVPSRPRTSKRELGEVIAGTATGRSDDERVTVFDTSGIAVQDLSASKIAYDRAVEAGLAPR